MSFAHPRMLLLALAAPVVWMAFRAAAKRSAKELAPWAGPGPSAPPRRGLLASLVVVLLAVALAAPRWGWERKKVYSHGADVVVVLDTSGSMLVADVPPNRFAVAQHLAETFVDALPPQTRAGLVRDEGDGEPLAPLTLDHAAVVAEIDRMRPRQGAVAGSNLGDGLSVALSLLDASGDRNGTILLVSDGEDLAQRFAAAAARARQHGVVIETACVGTTAGGPVPARDGAGYVRDSSGRPVISSAHPDFLEALARPTGGAAIDAENLATSPAPLVDGVRRAGSSGHGYRSVAQPEDRSTWPLAAATVAWMGLLLLPRKRQTVEGP
jgi:Ca-activated chloride channel homolog